MLLYDLRGQGRSERTPRGYTPAVIWRVPGTVTLLSGGPVPRGPVPGGLLPGGPRAVGLCLGDPAALGPDLGLPAGLALLGGEPVPCNLAAAGLRLMIIDPRIRRTPRTAPAEDSPAAAAAAVVAQGDFAALGALLTAANSKPCGSVTGVLFANSARRRQIQR